MKVEIRDEKLIIELPISKRPSKSGKTTIIASTNGNKPTDCIIDGKPLILGVNAYVSNK